jgi:hypothetical protein
MACTLACSGLSWADEPTPSESPAAAEADPVKAPAPPDPPVKKYDLKYQFTAGELLRTEVVHQATVQTTIQGTSQTAETRSTSIKTWQIDAVDDDGTVTFVHMVESIDMRQKAQGHKEVHYSSATDSDAPPGYEDVAKAVGVPLTIVTMDNRGKILKRQEKRSQPASISTQMTMPLPDHPVAVGETWSSPIDIDVVLKDGATKKIKTRQKFTLDDVADDLATIGIDSQILTPIHDPAIEAQLIQRLSTGSIRFDMSAGRMLGQQLDLDRHVIGFSGPASSMHYVTRFTEKLLKAPTETARAQEPENAATK